MARVFANTQVFEYSVNMKKLLLSIVMLFSLQLAFSQDQLEETVYEEKDVDVVPDFPGGIDFFYKQFSKNFIMPAVPGLVDKVVLSFTVETDGTLTNIKTIHDAGFGTAEQAIKILESFPKWLPGTKDGKKVRVVYTLPIAVITE